MKHDIGVDMCWRIHVCLCVQSVFIVVFWINQAFRLYVGIGLAMIKRYNYMIMTMM